MTVSRVLLNILPKILLIVGAVVCGFALSAPYIGLGENEQFILYELFGWARRQMFEHGTIFLLAGITIFTIRILIRFGPSLLFRTIGWIRLAVDTALTRMLAAIKKTRAQSAETAQIASSVITAVSTSTIVLCSLLAGVLGFEIYHRIELVGRIQDKVSNGFLWLHSNAIHSDKRLDDFLQSHNQVPENGQFRASSKFDLSIAHETKGTLNFTVVTNSHGLLSDREYTVKRDPENPEYRIAVLGDSFTGPTTSTYQWVDTIEEILNASPVLRDAVGGKAFRVYNFGWIGAGFQTFWKEYDKGARRFDPDIVIVNYIEWDYPRTKYIHLSTNEEMVRHAREQMEKIFEAHDNVIVTLMPNSNDMSENEKDAMSDYKRTRMLMAEYPRFRPVLMKELMPTHLGNEEILSWFNGPHDAHYSDRGGEIYARKLSSIIAERITGKRLDFLDVQTRNSNIVMGPGKPRLRPVQTSVSYLGDSPERIQYLKNYVEREMIKGRVFTFYPYIWNLITGRGTDGLETSYTQEHTATFIDVPYGPGKDEYVKLNIICLLNNDQPRMPTNPKWSLDNPECKHYFHIYARGR